MQKAQVSRKKVKRKKIEKFLEFKKNYLNKQNCQQRSTKQICDSERNLLEFKVQTAEVTCEDQQITGRV